MNYEVGIMKHEKEACAIDGTAHDRATSDRRYAALYVFDFGEARAAQFEGEV